MKKFFRFIGILLVVLIATVLFNAFSFSSQQNFDSFTPETFEVNPNVLGGALRYQTISHKAEMIDDSAFVGFHQYLAYTFPLIDSLLPKETVSKYSLIYRWKGTGQQKPIVLMGHMDVVPVEYSSRDQWTQQPFSGAVEDGRIWGRGAIDDKGSMMSILYAVELLLKDGFQPKRDIILCFGHDEEIGGEDGAAVISKKLEAEGLQAEMVLDEGGILADGIIPNIESAALIGVAEKGYVSLDLTVQIKGGHSSMPEPRTAVTVINEAIHELLENPLPNRLSEPLQGFVEYIGPELPFVQKMAFANTWLFKPMIFKTYSRSASGKALISTTQVPTIFQAGIKDNVVPTRAKATVNYRLLPGDTPESIKHRAEEIINDTLVKIGFHDGFAIPPSPVSDYKAEPFQKLAGLVQSVYSNVMVSPYLVLGATDGRYFYNISPNVYRFTPLRLQSEDLPRIHGINERISEEVFTNSVNFYATLLKNF